ncbi:uncharacterized protein LOC119633520 isoform X2 [Glossina fuscipes]|uniref:Uncharacterized protein LOC119633520 isoform X2 n=1 Tax=Glossina fuscipes TaxID=7396 RepID=A0A8U0WDX2_9MUSC|nr:uncharacterized protein LOC119633520 isoform X2 [Glossina fuscipes]XP_037883071.1 uncharacterized protein LOC119633520 isoform X2 [Glossina fuscipes]XP_037883079.1 uncharacterized protein LOC119633520 isoform X2 [Glossina fuscipes]XP_037883086.1 uncharacterized protein LOC119633520 isoform X2 [Glossina fuscipes]XP_037883094.1 uncharacterized protein LOC119633520 isoform X2 [Glossina fuscipes]XP_037883103.1 uncharacterized protein LOC119633520 isoform X2 [Glossina fuscipes]XP_037883111.1 un
MTFERISETPVYKGAPPSPPQRSKFVSSCMNSHRRCLSHRWCFTLCRKHSSFFTVFTGLQNFLVIDIGSCYHLEKREAFTYVY